MNPYTNFNRSEFASYIDQDESINSLPASIHKSVEKLPQYIFDFSDQPSLIRALKLLIVVLNKQKSPNAFSKTLLTDILLHFFQIKLKVDISSLSASEYEDGDIIMLQKMLANSDSDGEYEENEIEMKLSDNLEVIMNRSYQKVENLEAFEFIKSPTEI